VFKDSKSIDLVIKYKPILDKWLQYEFLRFLIVGSTTVLIDLICYSVMVYMGFNTYISKGISFSIGTVFAYFANQAFTFRSSTAGSTRFVIFGLLYLSTLVVNVIVNEFILDLTGRTHISFIAAFVLATALSAILNFAGMKFIIFPSEKKQ